MQLQDNLEINIVHANMDMPEVPENIRRVSRADIWAPYVLVELGKNQSGYSFLSNCHMSVNSLRHVIQK